MQPLRIASAHDTYRKQSVLTASPLELIVMLYGGLKKNMLLAKRAIGKNDPAAAHKNLMKAQAIVKELVNCLDMSIALSEELFSIYEYLLFAMGEINLHKDAELIDPVVEIIDGLKEAWEAISAQQHGSLSLVEG